MRLWPLVLIVSSCAEPTAPTITKHEPATPPASALTPTPAAASTIERTSDGHCTPEPEAGAPCAKGESWCVLSWGSPGGHSSALWCRNGRWQREEERNLP